MVEPLPAPPCGLKLVKKVRVGSKLRRVYDAPQTPFERVLASPQANPAHVAALKGLLKSLDPFQLAKVIDQKLEHIYELANRRLSPKAPKDLRPPKRTQRAGGNGCGKDARSASLDPASRDPLSHSRADGPSVIPLGGSATIHPALTF